MSLFIPEPQGLEFAEWGSLVAEQLEAYGVSAPRSETWQDWVSALFYVPALAQLGIPTVEGFATWQAWAAQFIGSVR